MHTLGLYMDFLHRRVRALSFADLFITTFFAYFLRFLASKYALRITIAKLRTERNPDFLSIFIHFGSFQDVFLSA